MEPYDRSSHWENVAKWRNRRLFISRWMILFGFALFIFSAGRYYQQLHDRELVELGRQARAECDRELDAMIKSMPKPEDRHIREAHGLVKAKGGYRPTRGKK